MIRSFIALAIAGLAFSAPASAKEIGKEQITQFAATDRAPRTRTECVDRENVRGIATDKVRLCTEWRTQAQIYFRRSYLVLDGPKDLARSDRDIARDCLKTATAATQVERGETGSATTLPTANAAFASCATASDLTDVGRFVLTVTERADWSGWR